MDARPTKIALDAQGRLQIAWSDGRQRQYPVADLRQRCPCATCREKRIKPPEAASLLPVLSMAEARPLAILDVKPVGNYAYSIAFSDGHDTGIFTLELLREIGEDV